ncbi:ureide permease 2 [Striga asiatica]|uniref:Ureide permease 2 n=1 Tax=Striga asiatica TaxID=4170 RepID=A0A5A7PFY4_STRAF|nr:ureide permease 2 [Striga asiatica]
MVEIHASTAKPPMLGSATVSHLKEGGESNFRAEIDGFRAEITDQGLERKWEQLLNQLKDKKMMKNEDIKSAKQEVNQIESEGGANGERAIKWNLRERNHIRLSEGEQTTSTKTSDKRKREGQEKNELKGPEFSLELETDEIAEDIFSQENRLLGR